MRSRPFWAAALAVHFSVIAIVSCWDIVDLVGSGRTIFPTAISNASSKLAKALQSISPRRLVRSNPFRQLIIGYMHLVGTESPYTFFAPNVPPSLKLMFEIQFADGRIVYDLPRVESDTEGMRLSALIDQAAAEPGLWRDVTLQMLAGAVADRNPDATRIRAVVATLRFPQPSEYLKGAQPSYHFVCRYDFKANGAQKRDGNE